MSICINPSLHVYFAFNKRIRIDIIVLLASNIGTGFDFYLTYVRVSKCPLESTTENNLIENTHHGGSITASSLTGWDSAALQHTKNNIFSCLVESNIQYRQTRDRLCRETLPKGEYSLVQISR